MKQIFDLLLSITILVLLVAPMLLIAIAVRLSSKGPALYWSDRVGKNNKIFKMPKFRSMRTDAPVVAKHLLDNIDVHLSPIGSFIRSSSIDELPQLYSVLKGDMSLVGPRPLLTEYLYLYSENQKKRHNVRPGITGWAQVNGRNSISWEEKFKLDIWYVHNQSVLLDLKILLLTIKKVLISDGISQKNQATAKPFNGNK